MTGRCTNARGCGCATHVAQRRRNTAWAKRRRDTKLEAAQLRAGRCPLRMGPGVCGGRIETYIEPGGRTRVRCVLCERKQQGLCRDCPARVYGTIGKAARCADCQRRFRNLCTRRFVEANRETVRARQRAHYADPAVRARRNEYKRLYRKAHPDKVRAQKRRYVERHRGEVAGRYNRYHVRYRGKHAAYYRELMRLRAIANRQPPPPCAECGKPTGWEPIPGVGGRPWKTCMRHAWPHQRKARRKIQRAHAKRLAALALQPKPKIRAPKNAARRGPGFERLCISEGCDVVLTGRKKKCSKCQAKDAAAAVLALQPFLGRGRRTDLARRSA